MRKILSSIFITSFLYLIPQLSQAATLFVSPSGTDTAPCSEAAPCLSIKQALRTAHSGDEIRLAPGAYRLSDEEMASSSSEPVVNIRQDIAIIGSLNGPSIIDGLNRVRGIIVQPGGLNVILANLIIQNGRSEGTGGAGIFNGSNLVLLNSIVKNNFAAGGSAAGGGIYNSGSLLTNNVIITENHADYFGGGFANAISAVNTHLLNTSVTKNVGQGGGGGIFNAGTLNLANATLSENSSNNNGGAILNYQNQLYLYNSTLVNNIADRDDSGTESGGGIFLTHGEIGLKNTILAQNKRANAANDCYTNPTTFLISLKYNIIGTSADCSIRRDSTDRIGEAAHPVDPKLFPLSVLSAGPLLFQQTLAPRSDSPAINAVPSADCMIASNPLTIDQRGMPRPYGGNCDIGAVEAMPIVGLLPLGEAGFTFPDTPASSSSEHDIYLINQGELDLNVREIISSDSHFTNVSSACTGRAVQPHTGCQVKIRFSPSEVANYTAQLTVRSNSALLPEFNYQLRGRGSNAAPGPDFRVTLRDLQMNARAGDTIQVPFFVIRERAFSGAVAVRLRGAPAGINADAFTMPPDRNDGNLVLHLAGNLPAQDYQVVLEGNNASMTRVSVPLTLHVSASNSNNTGLRSNSNPNPDSQSAESGGGCSMSAGSVLSGNGLWMFGITFMSLLAIRRRK